MSESDQGDRREKPLTPREELQLLAAFGAAEPEVLFRGLVLVMLTRLGWKDPIAFTVGTPAKVVDNGYVVTVSSAIEVPLWEAGLKAKFFVRATRNTITPGSPWIVDIDGRGKDPAKGVGPASLGELTQGALDAMKKNLER